MIGRPIVQKYLYLGSPIVKIHINSNEIQNTLIDLREAINIMRKQTMGQLKLHNLQYTSTLLQLVDRSIIKLDGILEDVYVFLDSWEYLVGFMILTPNNNLGGNPLILGRPWLATANAFISCIYGDMHISNSSSTKRFTLYPPTKIIIEIESEVWIDDDNEDVEDIQPIFTLSQIESF